MHIVVLITTKTRSEAKKIVTELIAKERIACANIIPAVESFFRWEGKVTKEKEVLIVIKSTKSQFEAISKMVKRIHSYTVPEIIALPIIDGNADYLRWIDDSVIQT